MSVTSHPPLFIAVFEKNLDDGTTSGNLKYWKFWDLDGWDLSLRVLKYSDDTSGTRAPIFAENSFL